LLMPIYEYHDDVTGLTIDLRRPVADRDKPIVLTRASNVPDRISIYGFDGTAEQIYDAGIVKALHRKEEQEGSRFRCGEFTKTQLKKAWMESHP
jgi:hypothetical protein